MKARGTDPSLIPKIPALPSCLSGTHKGRIMSGIAEREGKYSPGKLITISCDCAYSVLVILLNRGSSCPPLLSPCLVPGFHAYHASSCLLSFNTMVPTLASTFPLPESARANQTCTYIIRICPENFPAPKLKRLLHY